MRYCFDGKAIDDGDNTGRRHCITLDGNSINEGDTGRQRWVLALPPTCAATHACDGPPKMEMGTPANETGTSLNRNAYPGGE